MTLSIGNMWGICTKVRPLTGGMLPGSWDKAKIHFIGLNWHVRNSQGLEPGFVQLSGKTYKGWSGPWIRFQRVWAYRVTSEGSNNQERGFYSVPGWWLWLHWSLVWVWQWVWTVLPQPHLVWWLARWCIPLPVSVLMIRIWPSGFGNRCVINIASEFGGVNMGGQ